MVHGRFRGGIAPMLRPRASDSCCSLLPGRKKQSNLLHWLLLKAVPLGVQPICRLSGVGRDSVGLLPLHRLHSAPLGAMGVQLGEVQAGGFGAVFRFGKCFLLPCPMLSTSGVRWALPSLVPPAPLPILGLYKHPGILQPSRGQHGGLTMEKNTVKSLRCRALHYLGP